MLQKMSLLHYITVILFLFVKLNSSIRFYVLSNDKRCLKEEIHRNVVCTGEYEFSEAVGYSATIHVTDSRSHTFYKRENFHESKGKFAFTADQNDIFEVCISFHAFENQPRINRTVSLNLKYGVDAKNYNDLAVSENLKPIEIELRQLEDLAKSIVQDFSDMRKREEEMRRTNESTNVRVFYLSIFSMSILIALAVWQILYLRRYFKAKKLID